jgi:hypothetical protein
MDASGQATDWLVGPVSSGSEARQRPSLLRSSGRAQDSQKAA